MPREYVQPTVKPAVVKDLGGKVRIASLHPAALTHFSRNMAERLMPVIKKIGATSAILRGGNIFVRSNRSNANLFSADLTAASDYIDHELGRTVLNAIGDALHITGSTRAALLQCVRRFEIIGTDKETRQGAHMGLGTTWTILSLLNHYAGVCASGNQKTFAICGDDLIGFWSEDQVQEYYHALNRLGLVPNKSKSYFGDSGVFCEMQVLKDTKRTARSVRHPGLAELTFARSKPTREQVYLARKWLHNHNLTKNSRRGLQRVLSRVASSFSTGLLSLGGTGNVPSTLYGLATSLRLLERGPLHTSFKRDSRYRNLMKEVLKERTLTKGSNRISAEDIMVDVATQVDLENVLTGQRPVQRTLLHTKVIRYRARQYIQSFEKDLKSLIASTSARVTTPNAPRLHLPAGSVFVDDEIYKKIRGTISTSDYISNIDKRVLKFALLKLKNRTINRKIVARFAKLIERSLTSGWIPPEATSSLFRKHNFLRSVTQRGTEQPFWWESQGTD
jgi:hypothetical protein